jgi:hypothetical protein
MMAKVIWKAKKNLGIGPVVFRRSRAKTLLTPDEGSGW